jgi:uncharacterized membrane protein YhaH (DUF805 family)
MTLWQTLFGFSGRIGRGSFWLLVIAVLLLDLAVLVLVSDWIHADYLSAGAPHRPGGNFVGAGFGLLLVAAGSGWTFLALKVKRAHDLGHSGRWLLIGLIPVYGVARLLFELGFRAGSPRRNRYGEAAGSVVGDKPAKAVGPIQSVWTTVEPSQMLSAQPEPQVEPPLADAITREPSVEAPLEVTRTIEPAQQPDPVAKPRLVHPIMDWGKNYRADLNWPEFQPLSRAVGPAPARVETLAAVAEIPPGEDSNAHEEPPLTWTPAPSHEPYAELGPLTPEPANDLHVRRDWT